MKPIAGCMQSLPSTSKERESEVMENSKVGDYIPKSVMCPKESLGLSNNTFPS